MKIMKLMVAALAGGFSLANVAMANGYDDLPKPPPPPGGWAQPEKQSERSVTADVDRQVTERFTAANGGDANGTLSKQQAKAAGWGLVSDHFSEIDRAGSGYVRLNDVLDFMSQRSPQRVMRMRNAAKAGGNS
ncbi:hypothetical protein KTF36_29855 [Burkholderia gladioli]|nr:hypothetical protein [Burkholderia gladioli]MBU9646068.1 hypothetical protein [Burkholderia gladioli]